ncbi:SprT-like family protein [Halogeometricum borinquense DSM 11551]|uniref:SprT-like family n=2 Tax=Halogeometricum borinquense TaxID=60847 RepID=E4NWI4_HALBP|nr:SprT-like domain-containing protein [Halogeometricum borinquense]ADQ69404.1 SprT-like family [Halogeometricum borinquense DSM 11551]ELY25956.1 SprT-like family protein [Halogeometricum borinquense DSM 11551]RYJ19447.1 transcription elongation protein SprT [Halogeometricum borinquense]
MTGDASSGIPSAGSDFGGVPETFEAVTTHDDLLAWSAAYCERAVETFDFDVDLSRVEWEVSTRAKRRAAAVKRPQISGATVGEPKSWADGIPACTVSLTWAAFEAFDETEWTATLRHELVHVEQFQRFGTTNHGPRFKRRAESVDAPIRVRRFADPAYVLSCGDCGGVVARRYRDCKLVRRHDEYLSSCCSASLTLAERG